MLSKKALMNVLFLKRHESLTGGAPKRTRPYCQNREGGLILGDPSR